MSRPELAGDVAPRNELDIVGAAPRRTIPAGALEGGAEEVMQGYERAFARQKHPV